MLIVKLLLEFVALLLLVFLIRKDRLMIGTPAGELSFGTGEAYRGRSMYTILLYGSSFIFAVIFFWMAYGIFNILHGFGPYHGVLVVNQTGLLVPSLILGVCSGVVLTPWLCTQLFGMSEYFSDREENGKKMMAILPACLGCLLICLQFNTYMKMDGERIYAKKLGENERVYNMKQVERIKAMESNSFEIHLDTGESISTNDFSGNVNHFLDNIR